MKKVLISVHIRAITVTAVERALLEMVSITEHKLIWFLCGRTDRRSWLPLISISLWKVHSV